MNFYDKVFKHPIKTTLLVTFLSVFIPVALITSLNYFLGVNGFGPEKDLQITVKRLYVDNSGSSHYMVATDQGIFEIQNFIFQVSLFNSDELYGHLEVGKTYSVKVKGNKALNAFCQEYPYIIQIY